MVYLIYSSYVTRFESCGGRGGCKHPLSVETRAGMVTLVLNEEQCGGGGIEHYPLLETRAEELCYENKKLVKNEGSPFLVVFSHSCVGRCKQRVKFNKRT